MTSRCISWFPAIVCTSHPSTELQMEQALLRRDGHGGSRATGSSTCHDWKAPLDHPLTPLQLRLPLGGGYFGLRATSTVPIMSCTTAGHAAPAAALLQCPHWPPLFPRLCSFTISCLMSRPGMPTTQLVQVCSAYSTSRPLRACTLFIPFQRELAKMRSAELVS
jgi:hypothetical protein